jgi:hypothetical protein
MHNAQWGCGPRAGGEGAGSRVMRHDFCPSLLPSFVGKGILYGNARNHATRDLNLFDKSFVTYLPISPDIMV